MRSRSCSIIVVSAFLCFAQAVFLFFPTGAIAATSSKEATQEGRQMLEPEHAAVAPTPKAKGTISITPVPAPRRQNIQRPSFFATIRGNGFYNKDGRRVFLLGAEGSGTVYPWLYRLMGLDFIELGDIYPSTRYDHKKDQWRLSWGVNPYYALEVDKLLAHNIMPYAALMEEGNPGRLPLFKAFPRMFAERGHFLSYSPLNPTGEDIRWNRRQSIMSGLGDRPIWMWEMFNEVSYRCHDEPNLEAFRRWAKKHYETIQAANQAWGTHFKDFSQVNPPNPGYFVLARQSNMPKGASYPLYYDFMKSQEEVFGAYGRRSLAKMHELDPLGYVTVQSHCNLAFDYGDIGVNPVLKATGEDAYGAENMQHLYIQGENDPAEILDMIKTAMVYDITRAAAGEHPIVDEESTLNGRGGPKLKKPLGVADLNGSWRFMPVAAASASQQPPAPSKSGWKTIKVPGMWGKQGFAHTQVAWYQRDFTLPAKPALSQGEELLLSGSSLADRGIIYLNGKKIHTTHAWNEKFDLNIGSQVHWGGKNDLSIRIENHTFRSGHYLGGIRGSIAVKIGVPPHPQPMTAGQMATWLWTKAIHGCAGSVISYFYNNAAFKGYYPPFSPFYRKPEALKAVASIHKLINDLAPLVLTGPVRGRVALVYPMTSLRAHIPQDYEHFISGPMTKELARYYGALLFNHVSLDMVIDENLPDLNRYQAVIVAMEPRTTMKAFEQLKSYVHNGGVLMVADDCLKINDDRNAPLADRSWLGGSGDTGAGQHGTVLGGGRIYHLSADASLPQLRHIVGALLSRSKIESDLRVEKQGAAAPDYVEAQSFGGAQGRVAWYLLNWGADCHARIGASNFEAGKPYRVRNAADRKVMPSPDGRPTWTGEQLARGVDLTLPCQDPQLILIEPANLPPMALEPISPQQQERIDQNWHQTIASKKRILFDTVPCNERMTPVRIPTARAIMEKAGWGVYVALDPVTAQEPIRTWDGGAFAKQNLEDFQLLIYACPQGNMHLPAQALKDVKQFVANGGGVLLLANPPHGPHGWLSPNSINQLSDLFGVHVDRHMVSDPSHNRDHQPLWPIMTDMASHPLMSGVKRYDPDGTAWLRIKKGSPAQVLIRSGRSADPAGAPVAAAVRYGKGRVVVMGSGYWLEPTVLDQADNQRLLSNILDWLSGGEARQP